MCSDVLEIFNKFDICSEPDQIKVKRLRFMLLGNA